MPHAIWVSLGLMPATSAIVIGVSDSIWWATARLRTQQPAASSWRRARCVAATARPSPGQAPAHGKSGAIPGGSAGSRRCSSPPLDREWRHPRQRPRTSSCCQDTSRAELLRKEVRRPRGHDGNGTSAKTPQRSRLSSGHGHGAWLVADRRPICRITHCGRRAQSPHGVDGGGGCSCQRPWRVAWAGCWWPPPLCRDGGLNLPPGTGRTRIDKGLRPTYNGGHPSPVLRSPS